MLPPWLQPLDVDRLSRGEAEVDFDVPLAELPRLKLRVAGIGGRVQGGARFGRQSGLAIAELTLSGTVTLQCQRCMQPMSLAIDSTTQLALIATEADASLVPEELEPVLAPEGRISAAALVEEEMLLALPIVPLHPSLADCAAPRAEDEPEQVTQRPFAGLGELLRRK